MQNERLLKVHHVLVAFAWSTIMLLVLVRSCTSIGNELVYIEMHGRKSEFRYQKFRTFLAFIKPFKWDAICHCHIHHSEKQWNAPRIHSLTEFYSRVNASHRLVNRVDVVSTFQFNFIPEFKCISLYYMVCYCCCWIKWQHIFASWSHQKDHRMSHCHSASFRSLFAHSWTRFWN